MKLNILITTLMLMMMLGAVLAQDQQVYPEDDKILQDPKLTEEQQNQAQLASKGAPAKIDGVIHDPKLQDQPAGEAAPWKVDALNQPEVREETSLEKQPEPVTLPVISAGNATQQASESSSEVVDYRKLKGPNTQDVPDRKGEVLDYRALKGENTQPSGKPKDK